MKRYFCTYCDHNYLPRALALYSSLVNHCSEFHLWILCLSKECDQVLRRLRLPQVTTVTMDEFEAGDRSLLLVKQSRTIIEYYFTCTAPFVLYVLNRNPDVDMISYLDADLFFFSDPAPLFLELEGSSVGIIAHRFPEKSLFRERWGIYNVGWVSFRRNITGMTCLERWREQCIDWCYDKVEEHRFADQKYLDVWPTAFDDVKVLKHKGANLAPWNVDNYNIRFEAGVTWVDEDPLIFFHFHSFKQVGRFIYGPNLAEYDANPQHALIHSVYSPYHSEYKIAKSTVKRVLPLRVSPYARRGHRSEFFGQVDPNTILPTRVRHAVRFFRHVLRGIMKQEYFVCVAGHVFFR